MSNLDTTLREKATDELRKEFARFYAKMPYAEAGDSYPDQLIANWWLSEFHQLLNEKREAIEELAPYSLKMPDNGALIGRTHDLVRLDDVLSILKE